MGEGPSDDSTILVEFLAPDGSAIALNDLGPAFLEANGIPMVHWERPFRVEVDAKRSKGGNLYFDYQQGGVSLPNGLQTRLRVEGLVLEAGDVRPSQSGHPTRRLTGVVNLSGVQYSVAAYLTQSKKPYWVKVHAQKGARAQREEATTPQGGRIA